MTTDDRVDSRPENPSNGVYEQFGFTLFDSINSVPFMIPGTEGNECLYGSKIDISNSFTGEQYFSHLIPFEVALGLISALVTTHVSHMELISKGSYKIDTQLLTRSRVKALALNISQMSKVIADLTDTVLVDDSELDEQNDPSSEIPAVL